MTCKQYDEKNPGLLKEPIKLYYSDHLDPTQSRKEIMCNLVFAELLFFLLYYH